MKNIILSGLALVGLFLIPALVHQAFAAPSPEPVTLQEVVIVGEAPSTDFPRVDLSETGSIVVLKQPTKSLAKTASKPSQKAKVWTCGVAHESQVGGSYRDCKFQ